MNTRMLTLHRWLTTGLAALASTLLSAALAVAQAPPGAEPDSAPPGLGLLNQLNPFGKGLGGNGQPLTLSGSFTIDKTTRHGILTVTAQIEPTWHVYALDQPPGGPEKSDLKVARSPAVSVAGIFQPDRPPNIKPPKEFRVNSHEHEGLVNWSIPIELNEGFEPEKLSIDVNYSGQVCGGPTGVCMPVYETVAAKFTGYIEPSATPGEYHPGENQAQLVLTGHVEPAAVAPGGKAKLVITAKPNPGWHVYAYANKDPDIVGANKPTLIYLAPLDGWTRSPVKASAQPQVKPPLAKGLPAERSYAEPVTWTVELTAPADSPQGETILSGYLGFQTCDDKSCLPPQAVQFRASLPVKAAAGPGQIPLEFKALERVPTGEGKSVSGYKYVADLVAAHPVPTGEIDSKALLPMIGFGLLGGLILNLMPCVLPVIGLKILSFVQHGGQSRATIFALNLWFAVGLLSVFLVLATAAAFANLGWGQQFTYTWFKVTMVVVVFAFALSFLGVWEVPIPGFAQTSTSSKLQQQEGPAGAFFKGIFTTLLATPCSGPFLGPVFAYTLAQPPLATYIIFASVGLGMASPYLIVGAFPALVRWLPKPGEWMETVKQLMGFVLLGTVVYLFSTINAAWFIPTLALVMGVWLACWIIGRVPIYEDAGKQVRQWAIGVASAAAIGWFSFTFLGPEIHLYPWQPYSPDAIVKLQSEGKTVMVDFTAEWCPTCKWNFKTVINTRPVKNLVDKNGIAAVLADWTDHNDAIKRKLEELNSISIPLLAIYPANKPGEVIVLRDAITQKQLLTALEQAGPSLKSGAAARTAETAIKPQPHS
jgi:thiol:disulfide interchange protein